MTKAQLRKHYKTLRKQLNPETVEKYSLDIANSLLKLNIWNRSYYHIFLPIKEQREVNTEYILHILQGKDKHIVVSKSNFNTSTLSHFLLTDTTVLKKNAYHIPEPVDGIEIPTDKLEVVFVPLLAFDKHGNRVGYGKGFYDRFLNNCNPGTLKIGLSFFEAENSIEDLQPADERLDYCVTPKKVYRFF
ncbi:MAG TPA: 5-formyltetrahydrofolate cyclo-ligase [Flavobacteriaceae bacterium]|nr:5-formyltetrahydrofolate cyclo-ligase [Flavobacteriaceae bacterium]